MFDPEFQRKALSLIMGFIMQFSETPAEKRGGILGDDGMPLRVERVDLAFFGGDGKPRIEIADHLRGAGEQRLIAENLYLHKGIHRKKGERLLFRRFHGLRLAAREKQEKKQDANRNTFHISFAFMVSSASDSLIF